VNSDIVLLLFGENLTLSKIRKINGMTLVELLIVIAVAGVHASVAWPIIKVLCPRAESQQCFR